MELEQKLGDLEFKFLGKEIPVPDSSPFTPLGGLDRRIEKFRVSLESRANSKVTAKLPPVPLPTFDGSDLELFLKHFERWLRLSGVESCPESFQLDWLIECAAPKIRRIVEKVVDEQVEPKLDSVLHTLAQLFPKMENDLSLRESLEKLPSLSSSPEPAQVKRLLVEFEEITARMSKGALGDQERYLYLSRKIHPKFFAELRADRHYKRRTETYADLKVAVLEKSQEDWFERQLERKAQLNTLQETPTATGEHQPDCLMEDGFQPSFS